MRYFDETNPVINGYTRGYHYMCNAYFEKDEETGEEHLVLSTLFPKTKDVNGKRLYGYYGSAGVDINGFHDLDAIIWLDDNLNFVKGEIIKKCGNCKYCQELYDAELDNGIDDNGIIMICNYNDENIVLQECDPAYCKHFVIDK